VEIALARVGGTDFERCSQAFFAAINGVSFVPLGGHHDGGADGFQTVELFETPGTDHFWQISIQETFKTKIKDTHAALIKEGRTPKLITYCTSLIIAKSDRIEDELSESLGVRIRIRDQKYIIAHINASPQTVQAFDSYLEPQLDFLKEFGGVSFISHSSDLPDRALCVFLGQEVDRRRGNTELLESLTDSLILWALADTDPETKTLMARAKILEIIEGALPAARQFIRSNLNQRLTALTSKSNTNGREIRWYRKTDEFCLPHSTRLIIKDENTSDEILKTEVTDVFRKRALLHLTRDNEDALIPQAISICHRALEITFEKQGLELTQFLHDSEAEKFGPKSISDFVDSAIVELNVGPEDIDVVKSAALSILREAFYKSESVEREYFGKLSRTYTLLFLLKNEPRIVEYFRHMSGSFILYLGSDLLIRALSESLLPSSDQMTWNMFKLLKAAGSELILTEKTLEEIITHVRATDLEFKNHYAGVERYITAELARHSDRILIRAYLYGQLNKDSPNKSKTWGAFIGRFCTHEDLHKAEGEESLRRYLCEEFGLTYETEADMKVGVDPDELNELSAGLYKIRSAVRSRPREEERSYNDALQVLRIFTKRREIGENARSNPFGYRVWWLSQEASVIRATSAVNQKRPKYLMRPEFVLNFISLAPSAEAVRQSFNNIFPTLLGLKLSNRLREDTFQQVLKKLKEASEIGDARAKTLASELSDKLKGDFYKKYEVNLN
jgi:hypothetical protein